MKFSEIIVKLAFFALCKSLFLGQLQKLQVSATIVGNETSNFCTGARINARSLGGKNKCTIMKGPRAISNGLTCPLQFFSSADEHFAAHQRRLHRLGGNPAEGCAADRDFPEGWEQAVARLAEALVAHYRQLAAKLSRTKQD